MRILNVLFKSHYKGGWNIKKFTLEIVNHISKEVIESSNHLEQLKSRLLALLDEVGSSTQMIIRDSETEQIIC